MNATSPERPLAERQRRFAAYIRDPDRNSPPPDVSERRMAVYRELFFNTICGVLDDAFPAIRAQTSNTAWDTLVRRFFAEHQSPAPHLHRLPGEFVAWLAETPSDPEYLTELAHYEWSELSLATQRGSVPAPTSGSPAAAGIPSLSPLARLMSYRFPVHRLRHGETAGADPTCLLLWRDAGNDVHTLKLNPVSARLLHLIDESSGRSGHTLLLAIAAELNAPDPEPLLRGGSELLESLAERGAIAIEPGESDHAHAD